MEPQKFLAEQLRHLLFHVTSAKSIASQVLAATPDTSHWRDSFQRGTDTLNYFKQVLSSVHSSGFNYPLTCKISSVTTLPLGVFVRVQSPKEGKPVGGGYQLQLPPQQLQLKMFQKPSLQRVHQKVKLLICIGLPMPPSSSHYMLMIVTM